MANEEQLAILRQGVEVWNKWREENPKTSIDLRRANLRGIDLKRLIRLEKWDFIEIQLYDADLSEADLTGANLSGANLEKANLAAANLTQAILYGAKLHRADLKMANFHQANLQNIDFTEANLFGARLSGAHLSGSIFLSAKLRKAILSGAQLTNCPRSTFEHGQRGGTLPMGNPAEFQKADLSEADLSWSDLNHIDFSEVDMSGSNLRKSDLSGANLHRAKLMKVNLSEADLLGADLSKADLREAVLLGANLREANLREANLQGAELYEANFTNADLTQADLSDSDMGNSSFVGAKIYETIISRSRVYGVSAWDLEGEFKEQKELIITPRGGAVITVDNIKVAQFVYLLLRNKEVRDVINTLTSKSVLILGRFAIPERKAILDALRNKLHEYDLVPVVFDFDRPIDKDFTETIKTLAGISYFVIADITNPKSSPLELQATVPDYQIPFVPIIQEGESPFAMMVDLQKKYSWVLPTRSYDSIETLMQALKPGIIDPAVAMRNKLRLVKAQEQVTESLRDYVDKTL